KDTWVMVQGFPNTNFYAYLVTSDGLNECPIINHIGYQTGPSRADAQGQMKFSPRGEYLGVTLNDHYIVEIFKFNNLTGKLTEFNYIYKIFFPYGLEFSPKGNNIFITDRGKNLYQFDIKSNDFDTTGKSIHTSLDYD